jgi:RNA polymerase sigma-70 factor (ECF subfamily)
MKDAEMTLHLGFAPVLKDTFSFLKREKVVSTAAFREMLNPVKENLYNFIFKALNFSEDADDVFQETVLRALKYINSYKKNHSFKTWIFTIAHNEIKGYFRKNKDKTGYREPGALWGEGFADEIELIRDIYNTAATLKPKQRKVFFLFYDNKFSIKEIGEITGLKEGNIKFILNRSREIIREKLGVRSKK